MGVGYGTPGSSAAVKIRAVENRAGSTARTGTHASASCTGFTGARDAPKGALWHQGFGAPSVEDGRPGCCGTEQERSQ